MNPNHQLNPLIATYTTGELTKTLDITQAKRFFTLILGETGRGKTFTAQHWLAHQPGAYVRCRTGCTRPKLARLMAQALTGASSGSNEANEQRIIDFLDTQDNYTIVIDEANYLIGNGSARKAEDALNFLRDIWDITHKGIALIITTYNLNHLRHGTLAGFLEQFRGRMGYNLQIPNRILKKSEVEPIVRAYVDNPDQKLLAKAHEIASGGDGKIRTLFKYLELAKIYVADHGGGISAGLLDALHERYEDGGVWPEE